MLHAYLTLALRSLWRNRLYTLLNVAGIAVGLTAVMLIYWQVTQINGFDSEHPHADRLYRVNEVLPPNQEEGANTVVPLLPVLLREQPAVEAGTRLFCWQNRWLTYGERDEQRAIYWADTSVFSVLHFPLKLGDPRTALSQPNAMVIDEKAADHLFGTANPLNQTVTLDNGRSYIIRGVLAPRSANSAIRAQVLISFSDLETTDRAASTNWYNGNCQTFVRLRAGADPGRFTAATRPLVQKNYWQQGQQRTLRLMPIGQLLSREAGNFMVVILAGLVFIAAFILLIVAINFLNLTSALSLARSGEVALRTSLGATTRQVLSQFILEAVLVAGTGAVLGVLLLRALLPVYIDFFDIATMFSPQLPLSTVVVMVGLILFLGLLAGGLSGQWLVRQPVIQGLQGRTTTGTRTPLQSALVVVQFTLATILITCTGVMIAQNSFVQQQQIGFQRDNLVTVELARSYRNPAQAEPAINNLLARLAQHPDVRSLSTTPTIPGQFNQNVNEFADAVTHKEVSIEQRVVDDAFLPTFGIPLLAGRNLTARDTNTTSVLLNEAAVRALGYTPGQAVGRELLPQGSHTSFLVVGVFGDYYERGMHHAVLPMLAQSGGPARLRGNNWLTLRLRPGSAPSLLAQLDRQFSAIPARKPFRYTYLTDQYNQVYWVMEKTQSFLTGMALVTVLLACLGIVGLSLFSIRQRTREIGIRKVLGASVSSVVWLLTRQTVRLVAVAIAVAVLPAWWMMRQWLSNFVVQISFPWWVVVASGGLALLAGLLAVSVQSLRAAVANPVDSLRSE